MEQPDDTEASGLGASEDKQVNTSPVAASCCDDEGSSLDQGGNCSHETTNSCQEAEGEQGSSSSVENKKLSTEQQETSGLEEGVHVGVEPASENKEEGDDTDRAESSPSRTDSERAGSSSENAGCSKSSDQTVKSVYHIKWIKWKGLSTPIVTQNENGPCPLLAIINVLLLQRRIRIPSMQEAVTTSQLMEYLGDCILTEAPKMLPEGAQLNYEQNMHDAIAIMGKLQTGLDVNVKFTGVTEFEFTPECIVFDLLSIRLLHGWVIDPQNREALSVIGSLSYNQLVEKVIASKQEGQDSQLVLEGMIAEAFLDQSATQLTFHGLCELNSYMKNDDLFVFFRNNHFSTLYKFKDELFLLVTDQGYLTEERIVWETLSSVDGDGCFVDAEFKTVPMTTQISPSRSSVSSTGQTISQEDQDYLVALTLQEEQEQSIQRAQQRVPSVHLDPQPPTNQGPLQRPQSTQEWSDLQLALQLQEEENRQQQRQQQQQQQQRQPIQARGGPAPRVQGPQQPVNREVSTQETQQGSEKCSIL